MTAAESQSPGTPTPKGARPTWQRVLIWVAIAFVALNVLPVLLFFTGDFLIGWLAPVIRVAIPVAIFIAIARHFGGSNLARTCFNKTTADFKRREDPARGGYVYDVQPARASWLAVLVPLPLGVFLALWGAYSAWLLYAAIALYLVVAGSFVVPGARHRKPVAISVSPHGIHSGDVGVPLERIADLHVDYHGVKISEDPLMPGPNGVSTSSMVGRGLGRRQAARSFTLMLRGEGESHASVIAGGLTKDCAINLERDIRKAIETFRAAG
ncbi:hypothetical protein [Inquilinus sp. CAU 1745]|uniref:hypothetical protein n=1 Tax=Inquilinus sp. CAU 1745 TaxID=3140369 RepID=UPI00325BA5C5